MFHRQDADVSISTGDVRDTGVSRSAFDVPPIGARTSAKAGQFTIEFGGNNQFQSSKIPKPPTSALRIGILKLLLFSDLESRTPELFPAIVIDE